MNSLRILFRLWVYGAAVSIYTYFIAIVTVAPFFGVYLFASTQTKNKVALHQVEKVLATIGIVVGPLIFGWLFYLVIGRRLQWHDLVRKPQE